MADWATNYFVAFCALNLAHRALVALEIFALAAALSRRFFFGAALFIAVGGVPRI